jgi:hypothetical protein
MLIVSLHLSVDQDGLVAQAVVFRILPAVAPPGCAYATGNDGRCLMPALPYPVTAAANPLPASFSPFLSHGYLYCGSFGFSYFHAINPLLPRRIIRVNYFCNNRL